jgi:hypothetical protein
VVELELELWFALELDLDFDFATPTRTPLNGDRLNRQAQVISSHDEADGFDIAGNIC